MLRTFIHSSATFLIFAISLHADIINIPTDYPTIQEGIDAAVNGDTVLVAPGTYVENINFLGKAITARGEQGADLTFIDGGQPKDPDYGSVALFQSGEGPDSVLEGFTLVNGEGTSLDPGSGWGPYCGGGVFCSDQSSPTLIKNNIADNRASYLGGGLYIADSNPTLIDCSFIRNRCSVYYSYGYGGGGIYMINSSPRLINCEFFKNSSGWDGGGICSDGGNPELTDCTFAQNTQAFAGGGFCNSNGNPILTNCSFVQNVYGSSGAALYNYSGNPILTDCWFIENEADLAAGAVDVAEGSVTLNGCTFKNNWAEASGGAVYVSWGEGSLFMNQCLLIENSASAGGGISSYAGNTIHLNGCTFIGNSADDGGAIETYSEMTVVNCTFIDNTAEESGGAIYHRGLLGPISTKLTNCSFFANTARYGGAIYNLEQSFPVAVNCIFWADTPSEIFDDANSQTAVTYSCIEGGYPGVGNIAADPLFADPFDYDSHLTFNSPCRGSGDNTAPDLPEYDFEGDPRIYQGTVDMGADEFYTHLYITGDQTPGGDIQGKLIGLPGTSPVRLFIGLGGVLPTPLPTIYGDLWLLPPRLSIPLVPIPANGILTIPTTIPLSPPAPYDIPMQGLVGLSSESLTNLCVLEVR